MSDGGRTVLVVNTLARSGDEDFERARAALVRRGVVLDAVHATHDPADLRRRVGDELRRGARRVVVGGGDGTLSAAATVLAGTGVVLGVLPLGTANDFARTLGIPADVDRAATIIARGRVRAVDVGRVGARAFLNAASVGVGAAAARKVPAALKRRAGPLAYPLAAAAAATEPPFRVTLEWDRGTRELWALQVVVGNGRYHGGGRLVAPGALLDDRSLHLYVLAAASPEPSAPGGRLRDVATLARYAVLLARGRHTEHPGVLHARTTRVALRTAPRLELNVDGELDGRTPAEFRVEPRALRVLVPRRGRRAGVR